jgi:hypothetical protein
MMLAGHLDRVRVDRSRLTPGRSGTVLPRREGTCQRTHMA